MFYEEQKKSETKQESEDEERKEAGPQHVHLEFPKITDENPNSDPGSFEDSQSSDFNEEYIQNIFQQEEEVKEPRMKKTEMISLWTKMTELLKNQIREESQHANDAIKRRHFQMRKYYRVVLPSCELDKFKNTGSKSQEDFKVVMLLCSEFINKI